MPSYTTYTGLINGLNKINELVVHEVAEEAHNELVKNIQNNYNTHNANYFNQHGRTGQFLESFILEGAIREFENVFNEIIYDPNKMSAMKADKSSWWNAHMSQMGDDVREELASMLNVRGGSSTGIYKGDREPYWDITIEWIEKNYRRLFKEKYKKYHIDIE